MNVKKKIVPVLCLMSAYLHWLKPRMLSMSPSKDGKSLLLNLCGRSRFLIPMIVFTAFWLFDAQMHIEASVHLSLSRNVHLTIGREVAQLDNDDDDDDDNDTYSIDSYTDSSQSDSSSMRQARAIALQQEIDFIQTFNRSRPI
ncbi:Hypothetical protein CINCED_3A011031 [Cinara cedri]|uniref:Uncharacterized protein n=1 Tax=Cinara cedri TaxID=506608 RepID=A0A5E4NJB8_9HEMI|nr:Hypothetical protein CINCED_3A011031 [Cinara cedri]